MNGTDLNCDMGEGLDNDAVLMPLISAANIACGYHAGDAGTMDRTVALALQHGVAIGAHPSYPDRADFGRLELTLSPAEVYTIVQDQVLLLQSVCTAQHTRLHHVKPHGALYNSAAQNALLADAVVRAVTDADPQLILLGPPGSALQSASAVHGLSFWAEAFADRSYQPDGSLTPRHMPGALITDHAVSVVQVLGILQEQVVRTVNGGVIRMPARTICVHGDGPDPVSLVMALREALTLAGININTYAIV